MNLPKLLFAWLVAASFLPSLAHADEGHDHGAAPAAPAGPALPRFAAASELFELVGVVDGRRLTVYLDRFDDNAPVEGAKLELTLGSSTVVLREHEPGEFEGSLSEPLKTGVVPVTATVAAGPDTDLLAAEIDVHEPSEAQASAHAAAEAQGWHDYAGWGLAIAAAAVLIRWVARSAAARRVRAGGAA